MEPAARAAQLAQLYDALRQRQSFAGEDERMRWHWRLHQLQRQQQNEPQPEPRWAAHEAALLEAIERQISALPLEDDARLSRTRASSAAAALGELRLSIEDDEGQTQRRGSIPIMENDATATMEDRGNTRGSWGQMSRLVRAASGRTLGALTRSTNRDRGSSLPLSRLSTMELAEHVDDDTVRSVAGSSTQSIEEETVERDSSVTSFRRQESSSLGQSVPNLLRSMASYLGLSMEETFLCQICYEYVPVTQSALLSKCGHTFCEGCLTNYLEFKVREGQVYPKCFYQKTGETTACSVDIAVEDIHALVSEEVWKKYNKFKFNKEHERARQCPYCDHSQICAGNDQPECVCEACQREFCFVHSSAHQGRTCAEYDRKMIAVEKLNNALISKISKPCPGCQNNVEKTGGCNQMKCVVCNTSFCWICLTIIDDSVFPEHFQWWNVRGCAGNQMSDIEQQSTTRKGIGIMLRVLFFVVFGPPAFVIAVVFCILCCCFFPCTSGDRLTFRQAFTTCFCVSGYVLLAPVVLALGLAALGVVLGGAAAGAALLVCVSPVIGLLLLYRRDTWRSTISRQSRSERSGRADTATARDIEDTNDQSTRPSYDRITRQVQRTIIRY